MRMPPWQGRGGLARVGARLGPLAALVVLASLSGCATQPAPPEPAPPVLWADERFGPPSERIDASDLFAMSPAMHEFLARVVQPRVRRDGAARALVDALNDRAKLKLEYDSTVTRNAAQAFDARAGNCLSLLVMTAAFARELGMQVDYRNVAADDAWSRSGDLLVVSGHVNLQLGWRPAMRGAGGMARHDPDMVIDFLPGTLAARLPYRPIGEDTVRAMYMNNRAAEALMRGALDDAYAWARAALQVRADLLQAWNTLGVVYLRHGDAARAERVFAHVLAADPGQRHALFNQVQLFERQGRTADAAPLRARLTRLEPMQPFAYFDQGRAAMARGDYAAARDLFERDVARADDVHEIRFWLALAHWRLGDEAAAQRQLARARELSTRAADRARYEAKLKALGEAAGRLR